MTKNCPKCGEVNLNDANSCDTCGASLVFVRPEGAQTTTVCPSCGASNPQGAANCGSCGKNFADEIAAIRKRERTRLTIAISAIVIALILFALFVPYNHATLLVTVHSTHDTETVHYFIYVNGEQRGEGDMPSGYSGTWTIECGWSNTGSNTMTVQTTSTGGGLGPVQDSKTISASAGGVYSISLNV
ncbi:MAG: zinc ribbon domain-containing protein [Methanomassiliicoccales archaeon]|nr:zinc ribbon domain-containing protein [Methanomassiliicoccales archaeon]